MKKFSTALFFVLACISMMAQEYDLPAIPPRYDSPEKRIDYIAKHFWNNFDPVNDELGEQIMVDFLSVTSAASARPRKAAVKSYARLVRKNPLLRNDGDMYVEKYLYDRHSPLYNETLFTEFLKAQGDSRAEFLLEQIAKNRVGTQATDFRYFTKENRRFSLSENFNQSDFILLLFYDKYCSNCQEVLSMLKASTDLELCCLTDRLKIIAVDISAEDKDEWLNSAPDIPLWCEAAMLGELEFFDEAKYFFEEMPALYLLDSNGTVILKQAIIPDVIDTVSY